MISQRRLKRIARGIRRANATTVEFSSQTKNFEQAVSDWEARSGQRATLNNAINVLRHEFTTYDRVWRRLERDHATDPCAFLRAFHDLIYNTWDLVDQVIARFYQDQPQIADMLEKFNSVWAERKLMANTIPPECEEE